jgi:hypothetical protein
MKTLKSLTKTHTTHLLIQGIFLIWTIWSCGDHLFTYSASHKDAVVGTKNLKFGLIRQKKISTCLMSIARDSWPKQVSYYGSLVLFLCSNSTMKA